MTEENSKGKDVTLDRRGFIEKTALGVATVLVVASGLMGSMDNADAATSQPGPKGPRPAQKNQSVKGFQVITIGISGPPFMPGATWPATLVQFNDKYFLVDCGGGATHGLVKAGIYPGKITNMLFTHHHADHNSDYFTFAIGGWGGPMGRRKLNLVGPDQTRQLHEMLLKFYEKDLDYRMIYGFPKDGLRKNVNIKEIKGSERFELDGVKITTAEVSHTIDTLAYRFEAGGQSVVVSGDMFYNENIIKLSKDADILVIDAHVPLSGGFDKHSSGKSASTGGGTAAGITIAHATVDEIAKIAAMAGVKKLILTHLPPMGFNDQEIKKYIKDEGFTGEVFVAKTLGKYTP